MNGKWPLLNVVSLFVLLVFANGLLAQESGFCFLDDTAVDDYRDRALSWDNPKPRSFQESDFTYEYTAYWIARAEVALFDCPIVIGNRTRREVQAAGFGRRFFVSDRAVYHDKDRTNWIQLSEQDDLNSTIPVTQGWVEEKDLLLYRTPLTNKNTDISYKAHIVKGESTGSNRVPLKYSPGEGHSVIGEVFAKSTFYIYDIYRINHPFTTKKQKLEMLKEWANTLKQNQPFAQLEQTLNKRLLQGVYLLLGDTPSLDTSLDKLGSGLLGWMSAKYARLWNTREALEFIGAIDFFPDKKSKQTPTQLGPFRYNYDTPRHLILGKDNAPPNRNLYRIGLYSKLSPSIIAGSLKGIAIPIDVLFILDATGSMEPVFAELKEAIKEMVREMNASAKVQGIPNPYFGLTVYRDRPDPSRQEEAGCRSIQEVEPLVPLQEWIAGQSKRSELERALEELKAEDCDLDYPESLYKGLYLGVDAVKRKDRRGRREQGFREGSFRVVIHLGDNGDHGRSDYRIEDVSQAFTDHRINYYPIQIQSGNDRQKTERAGAAFNAAVAQLNRNVVQTRDSVHYRKLSTDTVKENVIDALQQAGSAHMGLQTEVRHLAQRVNIVSQGITGGGEWIDIPVGENWRWQMHASPQLIAYLQKRDVTVKNTVDLYHEGWVDTTATSAHRTVVLAEYSNLLKLLTILKSLISTRPTPKNIAKTWSRVLSHFTGDKPCNTRQKLYKCLNQLQGIHFNLGILKYSLYELSKMLQSNHKRFADLMCEVKGKTTMISGILEEKEYQVNYGIVSGNCKVTSKHTAQTRYWYKAGESKMGWIPLQKLP